MGVGDDIASLRFVEVVHLTLLFVDPSIIQSAFQSVCCSKISRSDATA